MYSSDPFTARKEVDERQAVAAKKKIAAESRNQTDTGEFSHHPEVRMAVSLRELVEDSVKKVRVLRIVHLL